MSSRRTAVVCDDDAAVRAVVSAMLEDVGCDVVGEADLATHAIEMTGALHPGLVVLDVALPGMSGYEALPLLKQAAPDCTVLVFSAFDQERDALLAAGADEVLHKSRLDELEDCVRQLLERD